MSVVRYMISELTSKEIWDSSSELREDGRSERPPSLKLKCM